jgi:hypothetical protein
MTAPARRVCAVAVILVYAQAEMVRLIAEGVPKADASAAGFRLFAAIARDATGEIIVNPRRTVATPTGCLERGAAYARDAFAMAWEVWIQEHGIFYPSVVLPQDVLDDLTWLTDTVTRVAHGVPVLDAAIQARAAILGKPRRRRKPADPAWLTAQITAAQRVSWNAMVAQQSWPRPLPPEPPAVSLIKAQHDGTCTICPAPIVVDQPIARLASPPGWCHLACVPPAATVTAAID